jgi:hypothetical protein
MTEGNLWLDYDLALQSINSTGEENLLVEVWDWDIDQWLMIVNYSNAEGGFTWMPEHLNITEYAMNKVFRIRFNATGSNSLDILSWNLDNIHIYRTCPAPIELESDPAFNEGILLNWKLSENSGINPGVRVNNGLNELTAFYIYRSINGSEYELLGSSSGMEYIDPEAGLIMGSVYCYLVNAIWESPTDTCESAFSNEVCVLWTGIIGDHDHTAGDFDLFPNPADDYVLITVTGSLKNVKMYNSLGMRVLDLAFSANHCELNTSGYPNGVYIVHVETDNGIAFRLLTIQR